MNQFIEYKGKLGLRILAADGLVAQESQQLYKTIVLSCLSVNWIFELQPIANCDCRIADIFKELHLVQKM
jgi:hypothetical protein